MKIVYFEFIYKLNIKVTQRIFLVFDAKHYADAKKL